LDGIYLHITRQTGPVDALAAERSAAASDGSLVLVVPSEFMGRGEHDELGHILMRGFFHTLGEVRPPPDTVIFLNSGVKLVVQGSPVLEDLRVLVEEGAEILACGTCLGYYDLKEEVAVGTVSNMYTIAETMLAAGRLVQL
jgi:selenium metabolism protein YedF